MTCCCLFIWVTTLDEHVEPAAGLVKGEGFAVDASVLEAISSRGDTGSCGEMGIAHSRAPWISHSAPHRG